MKVALVTGGSRGIGAETVKYFARNGYTVILNYHRSMQEANDLKRQMEQEGCGVHLYKANVADPVQVMAMFYFVKHYFKRLDVLVNNAGISLSAMCRDVTIDDYDAVMNTNARGTFFCAKHALPIMTSGASIVNVSSIWGLQGASCESVYSMSKFAVVGLTKSLALELQHMGISVNCICPPIVATDMCADLTAQDIAEFTERTGTTVYTPSQVAEQIFKLATSGETGQILQLK